MYTYQCRILFTLVLVDTFVICDISDMLITTSWSHKIHVETSMSMATLAYVPSKKCKWPETSFLFSRGTCLLQNIPDITDFTRLAQETKSRKLRKGHFMKRFHM